MQRPLHGFTTRPSRDTLTTMPEFHHRQLDNGLTLLVESNPNAHTASIGFFVNTGARDETADLMGVSHFLEHMVFKGTDRRSADDVNREFDELGANYNAFTSHEQTVYYAHVLPEFLPHATDLLADILRPSLRTEDFNMEKNVILEEIGMYEDRPSWRLSDSLMEQYFAGKPQGFRVLGTTDTIKALSDTQMRTYFDKQYSSDNIFVAAAGQVDVDQLEKQLTDLTTTWQSTGVQRTFDHPDYQSRQDTIVDPKLSRHYSAMMWRGPSAQDERRYVAKVLADVLGDSGGSRLYWSLVDPGLAEDADATYLPMDQDGAFYAYACCDPDRAEAIEAKMIEVITSFGDDLNDQEVERARNKIATAATVSGEQPLGRMMSLGGQWMYLRAYRTLDEEIERLMSVTTQDLRDLLSEYAFENVTTLRLTPGDAS